MGHTTDTPAAVTDAGAGHDYTDHPTAQLVLIAAPVDSSMSGAGDHRDAYDAYIDAEYAAGRAYGSITIPMVNPREPLKVALDYNTASTYNYARLTIGNRPWYLFIDRVEYINAKNTRLITSVDPFPTYQGYALGHSMVLRGHAPVAASQDDTYGDLYCDAPEPISAPPSVGIMSERILDTDQSDWPVMVISANDLRGNPDRDTPYFELHSEAVNIAAAADLAYQAGVTPPAEDDDWLPTSGGDHNFGPSLFQSTYPWHMPGTSLYYTPSIKPSPVSTVDGVAQGGGAYLFSAAGFAAWSGIMQGASWVVEGISYARRVPPWALTVPVGDGNPSFNTPPILPVDARWNYASGIPVFAAQVSTGGYDTTVLNGWREAYLSATGAGFYRKLLTAQYTAVMVGSGESAEIFDPSVMRTSYVGVHARTGMLHGEDTIRLTMDYNELGEQKAVSMGGGGAPGTVASGYSRAAANTGSAVMGLTNSAFTSYAARQAMTYNQALAKHLVQTQVPMNMGIIGAQSVLQAGGGAALAGFAGAGPGGAIAGAVVGGGAALVTAALSANNSLDMQDISQAGSVDIGAYQIGASGVFQAMSFRAWVQALRSVSGRGSAEHVASAWRMVSEQAFQAVILAPRPDQVQRLLTTWRRYGYMVGRAFQPARLDVMSRFSYWQTENATILGSIPQEDRERMEAAFNRGITLYANLEDVGRDVSADNAPVAGFTY